MVSSSETGPVVCYKTSWFMLFARKGYCELILNYASGLECLLSGGLFNFRQDPENHTCMLKDLACARGKLLILVIVLCSQESMKEFEGSTVNLLRACNREYLAERICLCNHLNLSLLNLLKFFWKHLTNTL